MLKDRTFWMANENEIKQGKVTDAYFINTKDVLVKNNINTKVVMEVYAREVPYQQGWGLLTGIYDVAKLLEGLPLDVWSFDEGDFFVVDNTSALYEPVLTIEGRYSDFLEYETAILGILSASTSISTRAARFRIAAGNKLLLSFGTRRVHPALAPLVERACYIAGFDGVSNVLGASLLGIRPSGTMPHALIQVLGDQKKAWELFDATVSKDVPRVALVDTFWDEKTEAIAAYETLGDKLWGIRLDTPASRRGDFKKIIEEVKWELKIRGADKVKIIVSGRLDEEKISNLVNLVDGFGIGTAVSYPPVIDFSAKIVEVHEGNKVDFRSKRGGLGARKFVFRKEGYNDVITVSPVKKEGYTPMQKKLIEGGKIVRKFEATDKLRERVVSQLLKIKDCSPSLSME